MKALLEQDSDIINLSKEQVFMDVGFKRRAHWARMLIRAETSGGQTF